MSRITALAAHFDANGCRGIERHQLNALLFEVSKYTKMIMDRAVPPNCAKAQARIKEALDKAQETGVFVCYTCEPTQEFSHYRQLEAHLRSPTHDPLIYHCPAQDCGKRFRDFAGVCKHMTGSNRKCVIIPGTAKKKIWKLIRKVVKR
ncbi:hypothetical protein EST38_g14684, partial [Candolleomyces aberdarensis]